jgi:hypothetical protein
MFFYYISQCKSRPGEVECLLPRQGANYIIGKSGCAPGAKKEGRTCKIPTLIQFRHLRSDRGRLCVAAAVGEEKNSCLPDRQWPEGPETMSTGDAS